MNRKLLITLAPLLLAIAAFAVIPASAQAAAHVYKNGVLSAEGTKLRIISYGNLGIENTTFGQGECRTVSAGYLENPTGGGGAIGQFQAFAPYECLSTSCTTRGGSKFELIAEKLPWVDAVVPEPIFRLSIGNKGVKGGSGSVELQVNCEGLEKPHPFGQVTPKLLNNGLAIGSVPTEEEFDQPGSGELESESGGFKFLAGGKLKTLGYVAQELIEVKNP